jgi:hypothetical protein
MGPAVAHSLLLPSPGRAHNPARLTHPPPFACYIKTHRIPQLPRHLPPVLSPLAAEPCVTQHMAPLPGHTCPMRCRANTSVTRPLGCGALPRRAGWALLPTPSHRLLCRFTNSPAGDPSQAPPLLPHLSASDSWLERMLQHGGPDAAQAQLAAMGWPVDRLPASSGCELSYIRRLLRSPHGNHCEPTLMVVRIPGELC